MKAAMVGVALLLVTLPAGRVLAQVSMNDNSSRKTPLQMIDEEEQRRRAQNDRDYQATVRRLRAGEQPAAPQDPWGSVRQGPAASNKK